MNKIACLLALVVALVCVGCSPNDALLEDLYTKNIFPADNVTYDLGDSDHVWAEGHFDEIVLYGSPPLTLDISVYQQKTMPIQVIRILANGVPTRVTRGIFQGFSLPIWSTPANQNEELYSCQCIPVGWDGSANCTLYVGGWIDTANVNKNFQLGASFENWSTGDVIPITSTDVDVETSTGAVGAQYTAYKIAFTIDSSGFTTGDALGVRLRRIAATADEIAGEFVVEGMVLVYAVDKLGGATP